MMKGSFLFLLGLVFVVVFSSGARAVEKGCFPFIWFEDRDLDGFGNILSPQISCQRPSGYVTNFRDCNDNPLKRGTIFHPGAKEPCNFDDYNCDGFVGQCSPAPDGLALETQQDHEVVTSFEEGHPFEALSGGSHNLNDREDVYPGIGALQSAWIETDGAGGSKILRSRGMGPFDFRGLMPKVWIKIRNVSQLKGLSFMMGNGNFKNYVNFNLASGQGQKWVTEGDWVSFTIPWNESDMATLKLQPGVTLEDLRRHITDFQFRLTDKQQGPVRLQVNRISAVREAVEEFPEGVLTFSFDDNWESQYREAKPKLDEYGFPATAYVIVGFLDTPNYMRTEQLRDLQDSSRWEISFHAFDPIMHLQAYTHFPPEMVERDILAGRQWFWENGFQSGAEGTEGMAHFAYPKGEFRQSGLTDVLAIARKYFSSARTINEKFRESVPPSDAHKLRVLYITAPESVESVLKKIEKGLLAREWIILVFHDLVEFPQQNDQWEIAKFRALVDTVGTKWPQVPVRTVGEVLKKRGR